MIKELKKEEIPGWEHGDVAIKTYSLGDRGVLANMLAKVKVTEKDGKIDKAETEGKKDVDISEFSVLSLAFGLHFVRSKDGVGFVLKPDADKETKKKFAYDVDSVCAEVLIDKVAEINGQAGVETEVKTPTFQSEQI